MSRQEEESENKSRKYQLEGKNTKSIDVTHQIALNPVHCNHSQVLVFLWNAAPTSTQTRMENFSARSTLLEYCFCIHRKKCYRMLTIITSGKERISQRIKEREKPPETKIERQSSE